MIGLARTWREIPQRYRYEAARCNKCDKVHFPPRVKCGCGNREFTKHILSGKGTIETFTVIRVAPSGFEDESPYAVGVIKMPEGVKVTGQVVDCEVDKLKIGDEVRLEFRRVQHDGHKGILCYGYKFVPDVPLK